MKFTPAKPNGLPANPAPKNHSTPGPGRHETPLSRRGFLSTAALLAAPTPRRRPNVVFMLTDDQGWGDVGIHGNDKIRTPNMDRVAREGVQFTDFHSMPVCSPTRACLLTGRYNYRTGVVDTYIGRSMMHPDEVTVAEMLRGAGYRTGIFGKWHLGDCYPLRAMDQGFDEAVVIRGGGLGQPSDVPNGGSYTNPILMEMGRPRRYQGYCTDIYTNLALDFIERHRERPFFCYLPTNAPHSPLEIDDAAVAPYRKLGLDETTAKIYAMVENADTNLGRVLAKLRELKLEENTILIFMTDNGPQQRTRYNGPWRGTKGSVYEGGIRVPFFVRWPAVVRPGTKIDRLAAHIDFTPTIADACGATLPPGRQIDGRSLLPLLRGGAGNWSDRTLFFQWHRGDQPEPFRDCAARNQRWKLVNGKELYDIANDPGEQHDVASANPTIVQQLRQDYEAWFASVSATRGYAPPKILLGTEHENPTVLTRQDWRGGTGGWDKGSNGHWEVDVAAAGKFAVTAVLQPADLSGEARFHLNGASAAQSFAQGAVSLDFGELNLPHGPGQLRIDLTQGDKTIGPHQVTLRRL